MRTYQSIVILKPDLEESQVEQAQEKVSEWIASFGGEITRVENWGKKRLAYRVKKNRFGIYLNIYHSCDPSKLTEFETELKLYDIVIKFLVIRLEQDEWDWAMGKADEEEAAKEAEAQKEADASSEKKPEEAKASADD